MRSERNPRDGSAKIKCKACLERFDYMGDPGWSSRKLQSSRLYMILRTKWFLRSSGRFLQKSGGDISWPKNRWRQHQLHKRNPLKNLDLTVFLNIAKKFCVVESLSGGLEQRPVRWWLEPQPTAERPGGTPWQHWHLQPFGSCDCRDRRAAVHAVSCMLQEIIFALHCCGVEELYRCCNNMVLVPTRLECKFISRAPKLFSRRTWAQIASIQTHMVSATLHLGPRSHKK